MRHFLMGELQRSIDSLQLINICGATGAGKTHALRQIRHHVDFEGLGPTPRFKFWPQPQRLPTQYH